MTLISEVLDAQQTTDLSSLSVDDLANISVTSVSRREQKLLDTAAAAFVITHEDIRRSGATTIPEVLRIVPGLDVARIYGNVWAVSARGSNGQFANKLLVMIDGRSVYTPLFSGVLWDVQDVMLEDVDRIEVIRGPGGTLWGANAVNGIINIITRHAIDTQGTLLSTGGGAVEGPSGAARYGGSFGRNGFYRIYAKSFDRPATVGGSNATPDAWRMGRAGFRADWTSPRGDSFTAQGGIQRGSEVSVGEVDPAAPFADRAAQTDLRGENLQVTWDSVQSSRSDTRLKAYYDYSDRSNARPLRLDRRTVDVDFQQHLKLGSRNDTVWGVGYRSTQGQTIARGLELDGNASRANTASAFFQDEIRLSDRFRGTVGTKILYDRATRLQLQPTLRLLFKASDHQSVWVAATRAVRTPSDIELYGSITAAAFPAAPGMAGLVVVHGNAELEPERADSYEAGYRWQPSARLMVDATAFHSHLHDLVAVAAETPFVNAAGQLIVPVKMADVEHASSEGMELFLTGSLSSSWSLAAGYSFFSESSSNAASNAFASGGTANTTAPRHQTQLRSFIELSKHLELDAAAYYVGALGTAVPSYVRLDAQISWRPTARWELSLSGQNLGQARHAEFLATAGDGTIAAVPVRRTVNGRITWRY